ncbi:MAG: hypothetical protein J4415_02930 [Candidatus Diapherotrites archaeon]|uniref:Uncharacterized protein n=1 Tax=Candidatus Iainarchaeum sp. TaxID=3101447 RepID=A0A8T4KT76_9ARCH|nr:hypothetical protein [Candidatus Diapherotrites archaeon]
MRKDELHSRAQLSLEYMLLLAAFFSALLVFMPVIAGLHANAVFASDVQNAQNFMNGLESASEKMLILGSGSQLALTARVLTLWQLNINGTKATLVLTSESAGKSKTFETELAVPLELDQKTFTSGFSMLLKNENGKITIAYPYFNCIQLIIKRKSRCGMDFPALSRRLPDSNPFISNVYFPRRVGKNKFKIHFHPIRIKIPFK